LKSSTRTENFNAKKPEFSSPRVPVNWYVTQNTIHTCALSRRGLWRTLCIYKDGAQRGKCSEGAQNGQEILEEGEEDRSDETVVSSCNSTPQSTEA
jgi:hypothetical protein